MKKIREMFDHPILRTTAIVGFPSETEEEFEELVDFIKEIRWDVLVLLPIPEKKAHLPTIWKIKLMKQSQTVVWHD